MKPLQDCLEMARGKPPQEFANLHPHPVLIGLGVLPGELQRNPAKASGTLYLNFSTEQGGAGPGEDPLLNQVFNVKKASNSGAPERIEVGGTDGNDINIPDHTVSRNHAFFILEPSGGVKLIDGGSTNGTFVNGSRLTPRAPTQISSGDIVTFGRNSFTFYDALSFAKLLSVQAMMRPRGANRRVQRGRPAAQLGGGRPTPNRRRANLSPGPSSAPVVDPFLGPPRAGRFSSPEDVRKAAATTDPRRAFPPMDSRPTERGAPYRPSPAPNRGAPPQGQRPSRPPQGQPPGPSMGSGRPNHSQGVSGEAPTARIPVADTPTQSMPVAQGQGSSWGERAWAYLRSPFKRVWAFLRGLIRGD